MIERIEILGQNAEGAPTRAIEKLFVLVGDWTPT
jgi:hypothetical protein